MFRNVAAIVTEYVSCKFMDSTQEGPNFDNVELMQNLKTGSCHIDNTTFFFLYSSVDVVLSELHR